MEEGVPLAPGPNVPSSGKSENLVWKMFPDRYFSWALTLANVAKGHLFVDLLPDTNQMYIMNDLESEKVGQRFEIATKKYLDLDNKHVMRLLCRPGMTAQHLICALAAALREVNPSKVEEAQPSKMPNPRANNHRSRTKRRGGGKSSSVQTSTSLAKANRRSLNTSIAPLVYILQDVENLNHETQMALVEVMTRNTLPVTWMSPGSESGNYPEHLVPGKYDIREGSLLIVALSGALKYPKESYSANLQTFSHNYLDESFRMMAQNVEGNDISPLLFQAFHMRIPIKLPKRRGIGGLDLRDVNRRDPPSLVGVSPMTFGSRDNSFKDDPPRSPAGSIGMPAKVLAAPSLLWPRDDDSVHVGSVGRIKLPPGGRGSDTMALVDLVHELDGSTLKPSMIIRADRSENEKRFREVCISIEVETYIHDIVTALRMHPFVLDGPGTHTFVMLEQVCKAVAAMEKKKTYVTPDDVTDVVVEVLSHQIVLSFDLVPNELDVSSSSKCDSDPTQTHPRFWHPLSAARLLVGQVVHNHVPTLR